jgi:hypothetical protein
VLVTTRDRAIAPLAQLHMALQIPGASIHRLDGGHVSCMSSGLTAPLLGACLDVAGRASAPV